MKTRVHFDFDQQSLKALQDFKIRAKLKTLAEALHLCLSLKNSIDKQKLEGFSELVVRNPKTNSERTFI